MKELEHRLFGRGTEEIVVVQKRLEKAREELLYAPKYDYLVVNDSVEEAATNILQIIAAGADSS